MKAIKQYADNKCATCPYNPDNLPEPMREEPEKPTTVWVVKPNIDGIEQFRYGANPLINQLISQQIDLGLCHTTKENAERWLEFWRQMVRR